MLSESVCKTNSMHDSTSPSNDPSNPQSVKRSKRRLFCSENSQSSGVSNASEKGKLDEEPDAERTSPTLTTRRATPLSERQQIALLLQLSASDQSSVEGCASDDTQECVERRPSKRNERGETLLHLATIKGDLQKVRKLLNQGARVNTADFAGWTPLHEACNHGWFDIAKLLIQFGANVNAPGLDKDTPLHDAAINKHEKIVTLLLKYGADPNQKNAHWRTPFDVARSEKVAQIIKQAIQSRERQEERCEHLRTPEAVSRQSAKSPCHPITALCDPTMRKNSPHNQTHKGADKPTSPRLTLRFQSIKSRDDKSSNSAKINDVSSPQPKYQSYCVTMETKGDVYDFHKEEAAVSSTQNIAAPMLADSSEEMAIKCEAVTSTCKEIDDGITMENSKSENSEGQDRVSSLEKMDVLEPPSSTKVNGGRLSDASKEHDSDVEKDENHRKRRKSNDSVQSRHSVASRGHKSPSGKSEGDQRSPKSRKRSSLSSSDTESNPSEAEVNPEMDVTNPECSAQSQHNGPLAVGPHSPKVPPLKIVIPSGSSSLEHETRERSKVSSSKQALPYVVNATSDAEALPVATVTDTCFVAVFQADAKGEQTPSKLLNFTEKMKDENGSNGHPPTEERFQRVTRSSQRMQAAISSTTQPEMTTTTTTSSSSNVVSSSSQKGELSAGESSNDEQSLQAHMDSVHPRKRKLRTRDNVTENGSHHPSSASSSVDDSQQQHQLLNSYQMYLNIRKQVI